MHLEHYECLGDVGVHEAGHDTDHHGTLRLAGGATGGDAHEAGQETVVRGSGAPDVVVELGKDDRGHGTERRGDGGGHHRLRGNAGEARHGEGAVTIGTVTGDGARRGILGGCGGVAFTSS